MNQSGLDCPEVWARRAFSARASSLPAFTSFSNWRSHASASNATYHRRNAASSSEERFSICCSIASTLLIHHLHSAGSETVSTSLWSIGNQNTRILAFESDAVQLPIRLPPPVSGRRGKREGSLMVFRVRGTCGFRRTLFDGRSRSDEYRGWVDEEKHCKISGFPKIARSVAGRYSTSSQPLVIQRSGISHPFLYHGRRTGLAAIGSSAGSFQGRSSVHHSWRPVPRDRLNQPPPPGARRDRSRSDRWHGTASPHQVCQV